MTERLQKLISAAGIASRRRAEALISEGQVTVNGRTAELGMSADLDSDVVEVCGKRLRLPEKRLYIMLNKPVGYVATLSDEKGRRTVAELVRDAGRRLYPVGRLDMWSEGLLIMTDDGEAANRLMHPSHNIKKIYEASVTGADVEAAAEQLRAPMDIDGYTIRPAEVAILSRQGDRALLEVRISEGRNRQVRKMCDKVGLHVTRLRRVAEGALLLGELPPGKWRPLTPEETAYLAEIK